MTAPKQTRRQFVESSAGLVASGLLIPPTFATADDEPTIPRSPNERPGIGAIGMRYQGTVIADKAVARGDIVAICDVDRQIAEKAKHHFGGKADLYEDYREMIARPDVDVVTIGTPDHWHTAMVVAACRAGKDVYCEKPLTLTIDEGKLLTKVVKETGAVVQVGTWQRSDHRFRLACELVKAGRIGQLKKVTVVLGKNKTGGPFQRQAPPAHINWDLWQGQTGDVPYIAERCHYTFRWWYEYSGGQMTDWGAHHLDIAQWGMGTQHTGPVEIDGQATFPHVTDGYNVAIDYAVKYRYANGVELELADHGRNGVLFEGDGGRIFVNRGTIFGLPVEQLETNPLPRDQFQLYAHDDLSLPIRTGKHDSIINHMANFFDCIRTRNLPVSDINSQHRSVSVCHLANISMQLGRKLKWDPEQELFVDDKEANGWLSREQRAPYQLPS